MCLTIPAKVISMKEGPIDAPVREIVVEDSRGERSIRAISLPELKVGDWVLYTLDLAVRQVSQEEAQEIIDLLEPRKFVDLSSLSPSFSSVLAKSFSHDLDRSDIIQLLSTEDEIEMEALFSEANTLRQANLRDFFCIHGIIEFSSNCVRSCYYCGLRKPSKDVTRYRMMPEEVVEAAVDAVDGRGYKLIVLQSGDDFDYSDDDLVEIVTEIKSRCKVFIFISVGERSAECYGRMKAAGASGVLLRFETSNPSIYEALHPGQSLEDRLELLPVLKGMGYYIASGFLIGLPEQTVEDIADDILLMKALGIKMVTVGPFIPSEGTPLSAHPAGSALMTLKVTAIARLLMPKAKIPVTTALETIESEEGRRLGLSSGANSLMFNLTPEKYRADYKIYPNKYHGKEELWEKYGLFSEELSYKMLEQKMFEAFEPEDPGEL
ncbi:MAG: [FeFe] hydrogenase H-cluster radical SAM maturase HydE [Proteobacteria bacterium]|nr:[FeFe] hydrogenase H-cluster radical SAM maturase HydE [Pseudomonadota bacterium]